MSSFLQDLNHMLSFSFIQYALAVGLAVAVCAALLGSSLVLKRYSMIGDGLSHVGFGTLAVATVANVAPLMLALPVVVLAAFLLLRISESSRLKGDAAIALISTSSLAIGVAVVSVTPGVNIDINNYLFGSILTISASDVLPSLLLLLLVFVGYILLYERIFAVTFDEGFARGSGISAGVVNGFLALLTALVIVLGMRLMGALLISSLIIFPALTSMRVFNTFKSVTFCSVIVSVICFLVGMTASFFFSLPTGAAIVILNLLVFLLFALWGMLRRRTTKQAI